MKLSDVASLMDEQHKMMQTYQVDVGQKRTQLHMEL